MSILKLSDEEVARELHGLPGWDLANGKLRRCFQFADFAEAFSFMTRAAIISEKKNHHPEWSNVYNRVQIDLVTHKVNGITSKDIEWAKLVNSIYETFPKVSGPVSCCG